MTCPCLKVKYNKVKLRPVYLTDIETLNYLIALARLVCEEPGNLYRVAHLEQAIKDAEGEK
jgi:hypothetical protein